MTTKSEGLDLGRRLQVRWSQAVFTPEQLAVGAHHELEHTPDLRKAAKIALDHLQERPDYYEKLEQCMPEKRRDARYCKRCGVFKQPGRKDELCKPCREYPMKSDAASRERFRQAFGDEDGDEEEEKPRK